MAYPKEYMENLRECLPTGWQLLVGTDGKFAVVDARGLGRGNYDNPLLAVRDANDTAAVQAKAAEHQRSMPDGWRIEVESWQSGDFIEIAYGIYDPEGVRVGENYMRGVDAIEAATSEARWRAS